MDSTYIYFLLYIISIATLGVLVMVLGNMHEQRTAGRGNIGQAGKKKEAKARILALFEEKDKVANNDVEAFLGVSDATATNYLQELEDEGKIRQVGKEGRAVYYTRING